MSRFRGICCLLQHMRCAQQAAQGKIVMAGALADPVDGAVFIFKNTSTEVRRFWVNAAFSKVISQEIEAFVKADPYVANGLVPSYTIRPYMCVLLWCFMQRSPVSCTGWWCHRQNLSSTT